MVSNAQLLTDRFQDQVRESLVIGSEYCQTLLYWTVEHNPYSLQFLIDTFPDEVKYLLRMENEFHETVLGWAVQYNTNSLTLFMNRFSEVIQDSLLLSNNCNCSTLLHRAAQHDSYSLEILINSFVNEHVRNDLLNTKDFKGNTLIHLAAKYNVESLIFLINEFPEQVMKMLEVKNNIGKTALRFAACNTTSIKLINNFLGVEIYGAERGISIPGIPGALSYYYQDHVSLLLKLRLEDAKPRILKLIDVLDENYVLIDGNEDDLSAKLSSFILNSEKNTILMPLNISGNHLVGIAAEKYNGKVILHYMDSELNSPPASLFMKIGAMLESYGYSMEFRIAKVEEQNYSNWALK